MTERTLLRQTRVESDDDDTVSITSSQGEEYPPEQEFLVENILAEKIVQNGETLYLISWADYPEESSTWEPREHIQDPEILTVWKVRKAQEANGLAQPFDYKTFDTRILQLERKAQERRRRRKAKRKQLGIPVSPEPELHRQNADDSHSVEAVESDDVSEDFSGSKTSKLSEELKKRRRPFVRDSHGSEESDTAGDCTSDDSLIGELRSRQQKKKAKRQALQASWDNGATSPSTKEPEGQLKPSSNQSSKKSKTTRRPSSSSSEVPLADVAEQRQAQSRSESTDTTISRQLASTIRSSPKSPETAFSLGTVTSSTRGRPASRGASSVGSGRGATRGGLGPKNVFASRGPAKKRPTLIENSANPSKVPKLYASMRIRRKAELAARGLADAAPDVSALGGLYAASNPSTCHALKPARRKAADTVSNQQGSDLETSLMDIDDHFVGQNSLNSSKDVDSWAAIAVVDPPYSPPAANTQHNRPQYQRTQHSFNAICHYWHTRGNCSKGYLCDFKHTDDALLPIGPLPPGHTSHEKTPDIGPSNIRPQYCHELHGFNAICHFWHMKGSCNKGDDCPFKHIDDARLPHGPPPPGHKCNCKPSGITSGDDSSIHSGNFYPPADDFYRPVSSSAKRIDDLTDDFHRPLPTTTRHIDPPTNDFSRPFSASVYQDGRPSFHPREPAICPFWLYSNSCNKGNNCKYLHTEDNRLAIAPQPQYKDETCQYWAKGYCSKTALQCLYLHGYPVGTPEYHESVQQSEPSIPLPIIRDDTEAPPGMREPMPFAVNGPMVSSNDPERHNPPELTPTGPRQSRYNRTCSFWEQDDCWRGETCLYWHSYDGSDKKIKQTSAVPSVAAIKQAETAPIQEQNISNARPTSSNGNTHNTQGIQHGPPSRSQTERKSVRFQTPEGEPNIEAPVESRHDPDRTRQIFSSDRLQLDNANVLSSDQDRSEIVPLKPQRTGSKMTMDSYRRKKALKDLGESGKEVEFGEDEKNSIVADFGDLTPTKQHPWGQSLLALTKVHFTKICLAEDFKAHLGSLQYQTLWQGSLGPGATDEHASKIMDKTWEHLRLSSAGLLSLCSDFTVLVYPAIEEWKFMEASVSFSPETRLRYLVFRTNLDLGTPPGAGITNNPTDYQKILVESVHGLNFQRFLHGVKAKHGYHFYLLFPSTASLSAGFIAKWLQKSISQCKIYNSQTEGSWDFFINDPKVDAGIVLIHETALTSLCDLPSLRSAIATKSYSFWYIAEGAAKYPMYGPPEGSSPGQLTATRLLPHGHAFFLTPSFLIAEPERAYQLLTWFRGKLPSTSPGTWKLVCAYDIRQYLLDLAIEKSAERDEVEVEYQGQARKDAIMEERKLGYATCLVRFQIHDSVVRLLSQSGIDRYSDGDSSDIADEFKGPIIYADKFIDADDEQELVTWFAGWAMCKLDQFRKFTVIGTAPKGEKKALRRKAVTLKTRFPTSVEMAKGELLKASRIFNVLPAISSEVARTNEISPASLPHHMEISIETNSESGRDTALHEQSTAAPVTLDGASIYSPLQLDDQANERPTSRRSSRSGIRSDEINAVHVDDVRQQDADTMDVDSPAIDIKPASDRDVEKDEIIIKEIKYEATTSWYERWHKEGKGWEHVYVDSWDKAWKYLGVK